MKEYMNLKDLKRSNLLVTIHIDSLKNKESITETFFSVSKQIYAPDLLVLHTLSDEKEVQELKNIIESPFILHRKVEDGNPVEEKIVSDGKINYFLEKTDIKEFPKFFNYGFNVALNNGYELFSVIEKDDIVGLHWFNVVNEYVSENSDVDFFFPIMRNTTNGVFNNLMNEAPWAEGLAEEAGKLDLTLLSRFNCIVPLGTVFKVSSLKEYSEDIDGVFKPFKESFKISHYYEFLMRMVYNDLKGICIPRIGYEYRVRTMQEFKEISCKIPLNITSIPIEKGGYTPHEAQFWMDLAKKEYFFDEDNKTTYEAPIN